jgi:hypothetical protein
VETPGRPAGQLRPVARRSKTKINYTAARSRPVDPGLGLRWLWPVATGAAAAIMTAVYEQQLQRGVPTTRG